MIYGKINRNTNTCTEEPLTMKLPYIMQTKTDCGPRAIHAVTGLDYDLIMKQWPGKWLSTDMGRFGAPNDTPWDHFVLLERLEIPYRIVTKEELKHGDIVLLHYNEDYRPRWWPFNSIPGPVKYLFRFVFATMAQHWAVVDHVDPGVSINLFMGKKETSNIIPWESFNEMYHLGFPNCAYRIGEGDHKVKWWHRFVAKLTGNII